MTVSEPGTPESCPEAGTQESESPYSSDGVQWIPATDSSSGFQQQVTAPSSGCLQVDFNPRTYPEGLSPPNSLQGMFNRTCSCNKLPQRVSMMTRPQLQLLFLRVSLRTCLILLSFPRVSMNSSRLPVRPQCLPVGPQCLPVGPLRLPVGPLCLPVGPLRYHVVSLLCCHIVGRLGRLSEDTPRLIVGPSLVDTQQATSLRPAFIQGLSSRSIGLCSRTSSSPARFSSSPAGFTSLGFTVISTPADLITRLHLCQPPNHKVQRCRFTGQ